MANPANAPTVPTPADMTAMFDNFVTWFNGAQLDKLAGIVAPQATFSHIYGDNHQRNAMDFFSNYMTQDVPGPQISSTGGRQSAGYSVFGNGQWTDKTHTKNHDHDPVFFVFTFAVSPADQSLWIIEMSARLKRQGHGLVVTTEDLPRDAKINIFINA